MEAIICRWYLKAASVDGVRRRINCRILPKVPFHAVDLKHRTKTFGGFIMIFFSCSTFPLSSQYCSSYTLHSQTMPAVNMFNTHSI